MIRAKLPLYDEILKDERRKKMKELITEIEKIVGEIREKIEYLSGVFEQGLSLCFRTKSTKIKRINFLGYIVINSDGVFRQRYEHGWYKNFKFTEEDELEDLVKIKDEVIDSAKASQKDLVEQIMNMIEEFWRSAFIHKIEYKKEDIIQDSSILGKEPEKKTLKVVSNPTLRSSVNIYFDRDDTYWCKSYCIDKYIDNIYVYPIYDEIVIALRNTKSTAERRLRHLERFIEKWKPLINNIEVLWKFKKGDI